MEKSESEQIHNTILHVRWLSNIQIVLIMVIFFMVLMMVLQHNALFNTLNHHIEVDVQPTHGQGE